MKIIQVTAAYKPAYIYGGPTMSVAKLCETLVNRELGGWKVGELETETHHINSTKRSFDYLPAGKMGTKDDKLAIEVLTTTANGKDELNIKPNIQQIVDDVKVTYFNRLTKDHTHFSPALVWALRKEILRDAQNDKSLVIHIHAWWNLVSVLSCLVAKWYKVPVVLSPRGMLTAYTANNRNALSKKTIHHLLGKSLLKYCHIHATSEQEKQDILKIITPKSITVIPNLVALEQLPLAPPQTSSKPNSFKLIFLSRIEEKKGLALLFDALSEFAIDWTLTVAGAGDGNYIDNLNQKAKELNLSDRINWVGHLKNEDKFKILAEHDLMVLTSYNENFANVVIESLSVGTAVFISNKVGLADYVAEKELGWIVTLAKESIRNQLLDAFKDQPKRLSIRKNAPNQILADFNPKILAERYIKLYQSIAQSESII